MTETSADAPAEQGRACGYSRCDHRITYTGSGRPREYCGPPDRVWEDGKTCKQKAQEERRAAHAAGVDGALDLFDAAAAPVLTATSALGTGLADLQRALQDHSEALAAVRDGAVARVRQAEQQAADALAKAATAEGERDRAVRAAAAAEREREQAMEAKRVAERMARDAETERERQVNAAWTRVIEHEAARAAAESKAAGQTAAAVHAQQEQQKEFERAETIAARNKELDKENKALGKETAGLRAEMAGAHAQLEEMRERAVREQHQATTALAELRHAHAAELTALRERAAADLAAESERVVELREALAAARASLTAAESTLATEQARAGELLAALRINRPAPTDPPSPKGS